MTLVRWTRFTWDLSKLPDFKKEIDAHYQVRSATHEEAKAVRDVIFSAFSLDMDWNDAMKFLEESLETQIHHAFQEKEVPALVVTHGSRIIGASVLDVNLESENHFISGPCVLNEYRNRGLGSQLMHHSLCLLRDAGVKSASGVTKSNVPASKFIYSKFGSTEAPFDFAPALINS